MTALETVGDVQRSRTEPRRPGPNIPRPRERGTNLQLETKPVYRRSRPRIRRPYAILGAHHVSYAFTAKVIRWSNRVNTPKVTSY